MICSGERELNIRMFDLALYEQGKCDLPRTAGCQLEEDGV
jgi:hypothetical protein